MVQAVVAGEKQFFRAGAVEKARWQAYETAKAAVAGLVEQGQQGSLQIGVSLSSAETAIRCNRLFFLLDHECCRRFGLLQRCGVPL